MSSGGQPTASNAARLLAIQSAKSGRNVVLCDTTGRSQKGTREKTSNQDSVLPVESLGQNISIITGASGGSFFTSKTFNSTIKDLADRFDQVFVCASDRNALLGLMALLQFLPGLVMIAGLRKTKKSDIQNVKTRQPIDLLFYD